MTHLLITPPAAALWQEAGALRDFPILEETRALIRQKLQSKRVSFDDLAPSVERDPALCLNLLQQAADQNPDCLSQISGAASCLSLLGMQELVRLMKHLPVVEPDTTDPQQLYYRRALQTAHFAGNLAAWWTTIKGNPSVSYARWSTMLASSPLWAWLLTERLSGNWFYRMSQGDDIATAARTVFGKDTNQWQLMARRLKLPAMAEEVFTTGHWPDAGQWRTLRRADPRDLDNQRALLHLCQQPAMIALMANEMAWHLHMSPDSPRFQRWLNLVAHWLGKPVYVLMPALRELQVATSHQQHSSHGTGLHLLLSPQPVQEPYDWIAPPQSQQQAQAKAAQKPAGGVDFVPMPSRPISGPQIPEERHTDDTYMKKLLKQLQQQPDSFGDWHYLMRGMLKGVTEGIGLPSAAIALLNKEKTALKVFYTEGLPEQAPIRHLLIDLRSPNVFTKLLEKPASLLLTADNRDKFLAKLPEAATRLIPEQTMMMSIDAGAAPIGMVMGFAAEGQPVLSNAEYLSFKNLCQITSQSLATLRANTEARRKSAAGSKPGTSRA
ncbi:hypothetical protein ACQUQU_13285 [Thalassolituus sp. LLYu03]|uniref:hypothetical protein n=1 Tax=Thalassolituus sp. LLYu03 TaxID=3421656 RepID=UPI003D2BA407